MKVLLLMAKYLPLVMGTVAAVEQTVQAPGQTKAQVALNTIQVVASIAGQTIPEAHVQTITSLIDGVVAAFNKSGVFAHNQAPAVDSAK